jgi:putative IMPACT (imprinted ancient) family translation regulator
MLDQRRHSRRGNELWVVAERSALNDDLPEQGLADILVLSKLQAEVVSQALEQVLRPYKSSPAEAKLEDIPDGRQ